MRARACVCVCVCVCVSARVSCVHTHRSPILASSTRGRSTSIPHMTSNQTCGLPSQRRRASAFTLTPLHAPILVHIASHLLHRRCEPRVAAARCAAVDTGAASNQLLAFQELVRGPRVAAALPRPTRSSNTTRTSRRSRHLRLAFRLLARSPSPQRPRRSGGASSCPHPHPHPQHVLLSWRPRAHAGASARDTTAAPRPQAASVNMPDASARPSEKPPCPLARARERRGRHAESASCVCAQSAAVLCRVRLVADGTLPAPRSAGVAWRRPARVWFVLAPSPLLT